MANRITAVVIGLFALLVAKTAAGYGLLVDGQPAPGLFPFGVAIMLGLSALTWLVFSESASRPENGALLGTSEDAQGDVYPEGVAKAAATVVLSVVCIGVLEPAGYVLTVWLYGTALLAIAHGRIRLQAVVLPMAFAFGSKYVFDVIGLALPPGLLDVPWR